MIYIYIYNYIYIKIYIYIIDLIIYIPFYVSCAIHCLRSDKDSLQTKPEAISQGTDVITNQLDDGLWNDQQRVASISAACSNFSIFQAAHFFAAKNESPKKVVPQYAKVELVG